MATVVHWTGREALALRLALRMGVRQHVIPGQTALTNPAARDAPRPKVVTRLLALNLVRDVVSPGRTTESVMCPVGRPW